MVYLLMYGTFLLGKIYAVSVLQVARWTSNVHG